MQNLPRKVSRKHCQPYSKLSHIHTSPSPLNPPTPRHQHPFYAVHINIFSSRQLWTLVSLIWPISTPLPNLCPPLAVILREKAAMRCGPAGRKGMGKGKGKGKGKGTGKEKGKGEREGEGGREVRNINQVCMV